MGVESRARTRKNYVDFIREFIQCNGMQAVMHLNPQPSRSRKGVEVISDGVGTSTRQPGRI